jgi:sterol desaturase/sphingolipid hydroxylase (fatty acid hydroxylase superfamily)
VPLHPDRLRLLFPVLVACALIELLFLMRLRPAQVDWRESGASLGVALVRTATTVLLRSGLGGGFLVLWGHRLFTVPMDRWWGWALLLLVSEFFYYWQHRLSHRMRWFWTAHSVHHSPRHLNFSAAYRLAWTGTLIGLPLVFAPMILLGFSPLSIGVMLGLNLLYQFWLHNEWMPKLGILDKVLNTPSNHRVHHATNPQYLDRNYGGVLIIFDRLFGTYAPEVEPCRYGLVDGATSYNPIQIALGESMKLISDVWRARSWRERSLAVFGPPT